MQLVIDIPAEDFNEIQFHKVREMNTDLIQDTLDRITKGEIIIDTDFMAIKDKCRFCEHCANCDKGAIKCK